jgi:predicted RNase H-like HicB family nuclease
MKAYEVEVKLSRQEDGLWRAEVPLLPGCFVDGETIKDVLRDIQEVSAMALDIRLEDDSLPSEIRGMNPEGATYKLPVVIGEHAIRRFGRKASDPDERTTRGRKQTKLQV